MAVDVLVLCRCRKPGLIRFDCIENWPFPHYFVHCSNWEQFNQCGFLTVSHLDPCGVSVMSEMCLCGEFLSTKMCDLGIYPHQVLYRVR